MPPSSVILKSLAKAAAARLGVSIFRVRDRYSQDGLFTIHSDSFRSDTNFRAAYARGLEASRGVDPGIEWRVHIAIWAARLGLRARGDFVECGVNAGFISSAIMHALSWNEAGRRLYLVDTFAGPVAEQYSREEILEGRLALARRAIEAGAYVTDLKRVRANFAEWRNAIVVQGPVPEALSRIGGGPVAFLHIDMNCARPERAALEFFWDRMPAGAVVLLDDYGYSGHVRQRESIDDWAAAAGAFVLALPTGQGLVVK